MWIGLVALSLTQAHQVPGSFETLLTIGDPIPGYGDLQGTPILDAGPDGAWAAWAFTAGGTVLIVDGNTIAGTGDPAPGGGVLTAVGQPAFSPNGRLAWSGDVIPPGSTMSEATGFVGPTPVLSASDPIQVPPLVGQDLEHILEMQLTQQNAYASCAYLSNGGFSITQALLRLTPAVGGEFEQTALAYSGGSAPDGVGTIADLVAFEVNAADQTLLHVRLTDSVQRVYRDRQLVLSTQERFFGLGRLNTIHGTDLNAAGQWAASVITIDGRGEPRASIVRDGQPVWTTGDRLAAIGGEALTSISTPIAISDKGQLFWGGRWRPNPTGSTVGGLFRDDELLLVEDAEFGLGTVLNGSAIRSIGNWTSSADGEELLFVADVDAPTLEAYLVRLTLR